MTENEKQAALLDAFALIREGIPAGDNPEEIDKFVNAIASLKPAMDNCGGRFIPSPVDRIAISLIVDAWDNSVQAKKTLALQLKAWNDDCDWGARQAFDAFFAYYWRTRHYQHVNKGRQDHLNFEREGTPEETANFPPLADGCRYIRVYRDTEEAPPQWAVAWKSGKERVETYVLCDERMLLLKGHLDSKPPWLPEQWDNNVYPANLTKQHVIAWLQHAASIEQPDHEIIRHAYLLFDDHSYEPINAPSFSQYQIGAHLRNLIRSTNMGYTVVRQNNE